MVTLLAGSAPTQTPDQVNEPVRRAANTTRYPLLLSVLSDYAEDGELSGGRLNLDGSPGTSLTTITLPWRKDFSGENEDLRLHLEATVGYANARIDDDDLWSESRPAPTSMTPDPLPDQTRATSRTTAYALDLGIGASLRLPDEGILQPLLHLGVAHIENNTGYSGPGATATRSVTDGILFNWDGVYGTYGASLALRPKHTMFNEVRATPLLRYDVRRTEGLDVDDPALDAGDTTHWSTLRVDFSGPTGLEIGDQTLRWHADLGYRYFFGDTSDVLGFDDLYEIGLGLGWIEPDGLPQIGGVQVSGLLQLADDVFGWSIGLAVKF